MELEKAIVDFFNDLSNIDLRVKTPNFSKFNLETEIEKLITVHIKSLVFLNVHIGKIYSRSDNETKKCIKKHIQYIIDIKNGIVKIDDENRFLENDISSVEMTAAFATLLPLVTEKQSKLIQCVAEHSKNNKNPIDILRKVVNSSEIEEIANEVEEKMKNIRKQ